MNQPDKIQLESFLPYRLNVVAETVSRALSRIYFERYGISIPEWRVMAALGQYQRMTARDIGAHSHMHKTKVSRAVATLTARRLIARLPNARDMREAFLTLTPQGQDIYSDLVPQALGFEENLCSGLTASQQAELVRLLAIVEHSAGSGGDTEGAGRP